MDVLIGICLIGRHLASSWDRTTSLFAETLGSIFAQTSDRFRVVVGCNEIPEGPAFADPRVHYLVLPKVGKERLVETPFLDIWVKEQATRKFAADSDAAYFYTLDQDDLLSNRLIEFLLAAPPRHGYIVGKGYALNVATGLLSGLPSSKHPTETFDRWCGSSLALRLDRDAPPRRRFSQLNGVLVDGHRGARSRFKSVFGSDAGEVPFPASIYRLNHGGNFSQRENRRMGRWNMDIGEWVFDDPFRPSEALRSEFNLRG